MMNPSRLMLRLGRTSLTINPRRPISYTTKHSDNDPFSAVDRLNNGTNTKPAEITKRARYSSPSSNAVPLTLPTTESSTAVESHPSTSVEDLHPLPSSTNIPESGPTFDLNPDLGDATVDWSRSFSGLSSKPFDKEVSDILLAPLDPLDVEIKPDGVVYLPEIKYRRILNRAFGPGGWGLAPRGSSHITMKNVSREYGLICLGRLVSITRGEQDYYNGADNIPTATEGCKSNALMRSCKDLGIASELWDPNYINWWKNKFGVVEWLPGTGASIGKKKPVWKKKKSETWSPRLPPSST
ncbi:hypothetical protein MJO29_002281 [Puccinia striiformis f. sp. tritici]|uniref:Mitochondrial genome maintenance protein MGM101 n=1 Tax=Puccinia striiformis TaxID=27350 RepID=A0A2S4VRQ6_9BASI|nr:hypothetical protein Pst134EA_002575 [Puccinia striiformis f. sp. tritici]KAH9471946.1 hypothetical protein Pst134EA_002575 [Puccinia striiformis f. sp. tritici]KAI7966533.1 hypothetical protein MJO29_002281 [Puccinia striiformis f. sp. tritici]KAI9618409.1 hypothetical protein KEM48_006733 [Puccinia striiformis f. sp. tritici PST-130]POW12214.1 hypothetical protein PSHT_08152 [Puccinia striiformis]